MNEPVCTYTKKRCYTKDDASAVLRAAKSRWNRSSVIPKRSYFCKECGFWHLTASLSENERHKHQPLKIINAQEEFDLSEVL